MSDSEYLAALGYVYLGQIVAFAFCQLLLLQPNNRVQIFFWQMASGFSALSILGAPHILTVFSSQNLVPWAAFSSLVGGLFRYLSVSFRTNRLTLDRWSKGLAIASIVGTPFALSSALVEYRLLIASVVGIAISVACFIAALRNRYWASENEFGRSLLLLGMALSVVGLAVRGFTSYPLGEDKLFAGVSSLQIHGMEILTAISFFLQIGFLGMLVGRQDKDAKFADRRTVRAWQRSAILEQRGRNLRDLAAQRLDLIQVLTHEVRQPINNAQASLQSITPELDKVSTLSEPAAHALDRAKSALDGITLALSNFIVIGTLSAEDQDWRRYPTDALEVLEMARLDCSSANRTRIKLTPPDDQIFIECVPIFLRVALHNLFEHALVLAPMDSVLEASVAVDEVKLGVTFTLAGMMNAEEAKGTIYLPDLRITDTEPSQMTSLGFFAANLVAKQHLGECSIEDRADGSIIIKMFIQ